VAGVADIGLTHKDIHDARIIRDAEATQPGIVRQTVDEALMTGDEPTRAAVKRAALKVVKGGNQQPPRPRLERPATPQHTQHDRDLQMLVGVWGAACGTAQLAFLHTVCSEFQIRSER
jgi:hypothetical protein